MPPMGETRLCIRVYLACGDILVAGKGLIEALKAIREEGSIRGAARKLGINTKRLWLRITRAERLLGVKLVEAHARGSRLTREAESIIEAYEALVKSLEPLCRRVPGVECVS